MTAGRSSGGPYRPGRPNLRMPRFEGTARSAAPGVTIGHAELFVREAPARAGQENARPRKKRLRKQNTRPDDEAQTEGAPAPAETGRPCRPPPGDRPHHLIRGAHGLRLAEKLAQKEKSRDIVAASSSRGARGAALVYSTRMFAACRPFWPCFTSNSTRWFSCRLRKPPLLRISV